VVVVPAESAPEQVMQVVEGLVPRYGELPGNARVAGELGGQEVLGDAARITGTGAVRWRRLSCGPSCGQTCAAGLSLLAPLFGADRHPRPARAYARFAVARRVEPLPLRAAPAAARVQELRTR
jgi:hypothetical protein